MDTDMELTTKLSVMLCDAGRLKRDMVVRLAQLAHDYSKAMDVKMTKQAKRMMRENVTATNQLAMLSDQTTQLIRDNERAKRGESQLKVRLGVMESLEHEWSKKLRSNARVLSSKNYNNN